MIKYRTFNLNTSEPKKFEYEIVFKNDNECSLPILLKEIKKIQKMYKVKNVGILSSDCRYPTVKAKKILAMQPRVIGKDFEYFFAR